MELKAWVDELKELVYGGKASALVERLQQLQDETPKQGPGNKGRREALREAIGYFQPVSYTHLCESDYSGGPTCTLPPGDHNFYCNGNDCYYPGGTTKDPITDANIFQLMDDQPTSWKVYTQNYLNAGGTVNTPDSARGTHYYARHNGAVWYLSLIHI